VSEFGSVEYDVKASKGFLEDARRLAAEPAARLSSTVRLLRDHGIGYGSLKTRPIERNPSPMFRLMNVDAGYRIVAAVEGRRVLLLKVGNHDEAERWGEKASLREFEDRLDFDASTIGPEKRASKWPAKGVLVKAEPTLAQIIESDQVTDLVTDCVGGVLDGWLDGTIEEWMIFLSPVQRRAVDRAVGGPARVTGGPGTGKSVVGLHRAVAFASEAPGDERILMTSFVRTVPEVLSGLFEKLAPDLAARVTFASVHSLAMKALGASRPHVDAAAAHRRFVRVLHGNPDRYRQLSGGARLSDDYLWEEFTRVIEGRGLTRRVEYLGLQRHGRKRAIAALVRGLIWDVYEEYRAACDQGPEPVVDWDRVLQLALAHVKAQPVADRYSAIIVDEAQDISEVGVRFLLELFEGGATGRIMLLGDAGQRIYPGGYRLAELGLEIRGRSFPMTVCYRSTDEIMQAVGSLGQFVSTEEFGADGVRGLSLSTVRSGTRPRLHVFMLEADEINWLMSQLDRDDPELDGSAILVFTNRLAEAWRSRLREAGIGSVALDVYSGRPIPGVKVGTYHRAKGLEFKHLFLPHLDDSFPRGDQNDPDELIEAGSLLYVAMSRARDDLNLSYAGKPSMFIEALLPNVDVIEEEAVST
jgi:superfamily I DNA/RNA helicase